VLTVLCNEWPSEKADIIRTENLHVVSFKIKIKHPVTIARFLENHS
jgi:hypothetical protein